MGTYQSVKTINPYGVETDVLKINSDGESYILRNVIGRVGDYTFSVWHKGEGMTVSLFGALGYIPQSTDWQKYVQTAKVTNLTNVSIAFSPDSNADAYLFESYCAEGTVDTSWSPNPEDQKETNQEILAEANEAKKVATNFIATDSLGMMVYDGSSGTHTPTNPGTNTRNVLIDSDSVDIRQGTDVLATFGSTTRIGKSNAENVTIDNNGVTVNTSRKSDALRFRTVTVGSSDVAGCINFGGPDNVRAPIIQGVYGSTSSANYQNLDMKVADDGSSHARVQMEAESRTTGPSADSVANVRAQNYSGDPFAIMEAYRSENGEIQRSEIAVSPDGVLITGNLSINAQDVSWVNETGVDGNWRYRKYSDGTFDAWGTFTVLPTSSTASGSIFYSDSITVALPFTAISGSGVATGSVGTQVAWVVNTSVATANVSFRIARGAAISTSTELSVRLHVFGEY